MTEPKIVWALRRTDMPGTKLLTASGNWLAPWIFGSREAARKAARECLEHLLAVTPVKIKFQAMITVPAKGPR